jgi:hypothetical protein
MTRELRVRAKVLGRVQDETLRIILGPGEGQLDGGVHVEVQLALVPAELRVPNTELEAVPDPLSRAIVAIRALGPISST